MQTAVRERSFLLNTLEKRLETPMLVLSFIWQQWAQTIFLRLVKVATFFVTEDTKKNQEIKNSSEPNLSQISDQLVRLELEIQKLRSKLEEKA